MDELLSQDEINALLSGGSFTPPTPSEFSMEDAQVLDEVAAVVGMGGRAGRHHAAEIAGHDDIRVGAADPALHLAALFGTDPARPHVAVLAGKAQLAEGAVRALGLVPVPGRFHPVPAGLFDHLLRVVPD